jgi:nucleoside-diphosphate-sugar epimerase
MSPALSKHEMKQVLVTGATGFLGQTIIRKLLAHGTAVRALVRTPQKSALLSGLGAEIVVCDIRDTAIHSALTDVDTVIHCAAAIGPGSLPREVFHSINVEGTRNLVEGLIGSRTLRRFVHVSTVAVVGETDPKNPADENATCRPLDVYGETKLLGEQLVLIAARSGFPVVVARPMWIYGSSSTVTANLFRKIAQRKLPMIGRATNTMQPIAIEDTAEGLLKCALTPGVEGCVYNLAGPEILTIRSICETIADLMGTTLPNIPLPLSLATLLAAISESIFPALGMTPPLTRKKLDFFRRNNSYSIARARRELDWNPRITFRQGASQIAEKLKQTQSS